MQEQLRSDNIKPPQTVVDIYCSTAVSMSSDDNSTNSPKYVSVLYHHVSQLVHNQVTEINHSSTNEQISRWAKQDLEPTLSTKDD